jgi:hypothetical protein
MGLDGPGLILGSARFVSSPVSRLALVPTQTPIQWVSGAPSPGGVKQQGHKADCSPPFSAEVMNGGAILPLPHVLMA